MDYVLQIVVWYWFFLIEDVGDGFLGVEYWLNYMLFFDFVEEVLKLVFNFSKNKKEGFSLGFLE